MFKKLLVTCVALCLWSDAQAIVVASEHTLMCTEWRIEATQWARYRAEEAQREERDRQIEEGVAKQDPFRSPPHQQIPNRLADQLRRLKRTF